MKLLKNILTIFSLFTILFLFSGCNTNQKNNNQSNIKANFAKLSTTKENNTNNPPKQPVETQLSYFSTPLKSGVAARLTNIQLTCGKINERILQNGETFSFNQIVGPCTPEEGYKKAEIYVNKKISFAYGGGNCQVSTTLFNAALAVQGIDVIERHEHNRKKCRLY